MINFKKILISLAYPLALASGFLTPTHAQITWPENYTKPGWVYQGMRGRDYLIPKVAADSASLPTYPLLWTNGTRRDSSRGALAWTIAENKLWKWNGTAWSSVGGTGGGVGITYPNTSLKYLTGYGTFGSFNDSARAALSAGTGLTYNSTTGVFTNSITQYTNALARAAISLTTTGTSGAATYNSGTGVLNVPEYRTTPAGSTGQIQFNNSGSFGANSLLHWDNSNERLGIGTSSPSERFHYVGSASGSVIQMTFSAGNTTNGHGGFRMVARTVGSTLGTLGAISVVPFNSSQAEYRSNLVTRAVGATQFVTGTFFEFRPNNTYSETGLDNTKRRARVYDQGSIWSDSEVSTAPAASAVMELTSTTRGFLPPRMTTAQRNAISSPATGLIIFCTDCTATDGSTGVSQTYSSSSWKNHY